MGSGSVPSGPGTPAAEGRWLGALDLWAGALLGMVLLAACGGEEPASLAPTPSLAGSRPNIVLVTLCSFRPDRLQAGGGDRPLTPFLDRLAAEGAFFENAVSASSWTKPSTASLLTGLTPNVHGMVDYYPVDALARGEVPNPRVLAEEVVTLPEALAGVGYATACRVNNIHAGEFFGLLQGCQDRRSERHLSTEEMVRDLESWLAVVPEDQPFFFHLFTRHVHTPYLPPYEDYQRLDRSGDPWAEGDFPSRQVAFDREVRTLVRSGEGVPADMQQRWVDLYEAQFPSLDRALARIPEVLGAAGRERNTLFVITGDHGERFFEGGRIGHGGFLDRETLAIPLVFSGGGVPPGRRFTGVVRSIDLFPTLAELAGAPVPGEVLGVSLLPALVGEQADLAAFSSFGGKAHALRRGPWRLYLDASAGPGQASHGGQSTGRRSGKLRLYYLPTDPWEQKDLYRERPDQARELEQELARWLQQEQILGQRFARPDVRSLDAESINELKALGYL